jgi:hypothetical protein
MVCNPASYSGGLGFQSQTSNYLNQVLFLKLIAGKGFTFPVMDRIWVPYSEEPVAGPSVRAVRGIGLDRLDADTMGSNPA